LSGEVLTFDSMQPPAFMGDFIDASAATFTITAVV